MPNSLDNEIDFPHTFFLDLDQPCIRIFGKKFYSLSHPYQLKEQQAAGLEKEIIGNERINRNIDFQTKL